MNIETLRARTRTRRARAALCLGIVVPAAVGVLAVSNTASASEGATNSSVTESGSALVIDKLPAGVPTSGSVSVGAVPATTEAGGTQTITSSAAVVGQLPAGVPMSASVSAHAIPTK
jgi:hypothetical protein